MIEWIMPKVSVIIPTYNRAHLIKQSVQSVLEQSYQNFEVIIVDDGSSDNTEKVIRDLGNPEKIIYRYQENQGRSNARNHALQIATGQYITFLDSDDIYLPNKLQMQVEYLDAQPEVGMVYASAICEDESGNSLGFQYHASAHGYIYEQVAFYIPVTIILPTVMVRREIIEKVGYFDENLNRFEDTDYWRRISRLCLVGVIPEVLCRIKTHSGNTLASQDPVTLVNDVKKYVNKVLSEDVNESAKFLRHGSCRLYFSYGYGIIDLHDSRWLNASKELMKLASESDKLEFIRLKILAYFPQKINNLLRMILSDRVYFKLRDSYRSLKYADRKKN
jgi:glycosyltransferase involved in cell wall biosynthesis